MKGGNLLCIRCAVRVHLSQARFKVFAVDCNGRAVGDIGRGVLQSRVMCGLWGGEVLVCSVKDWTVARKVHSWLAKTQDELACDEDLLARFLCMSGLLLAGFLQAMSSPRCLVGSLGSLWWNDVLSGVSLG